MRFILVADHVDLPLRGGLLQDLASGLGGAGGSGWPANTLLYIGASASSTVSPSDPVVARAGVLVVTEELDEAGFKSALGQLLGSYRAGASSGALTPTGAQVAAAVPGGGGASEAAAAAAPPPPPVELSEAELADAVAWAKRHAGGVSLRAAALYAKLFAGGGGGGGDDGAGLA